MRLEEEIRMNIFDKCRYLHDAISADLEEIERLKRLAKTIPTADPSKELIGGGFASGARYTELIHKAMDLETTLLDMVDARLDCEREIYDILNRLDTVDPLGALVLRKFYIQEMTVKEIAIQLDFSERYIQDIKSRAITKCEKLRTTSRSFGI
jgi:hypothetical protein